MQKEKHKDTSSSLTHHKTALLSTKARGKREKKGGRKSRNTLERNKCNSDFSSAPPTMEGGPTASVADKGRIRDAREIFRTTCVIVPGTEIHRQQGARMGKERQGLKFAQNNARTGQERAGNAQQEREL